ncbi:MAG: hypothetical protein ACI9VR_000961 [Cognaticolwellia sp.]|jgi:hypothetical protein
MTKKLSFALMLMGALVACGEEEDTGDTADTADTGTETGDVDLSVLTDTESCSDVYLAKVDPAGALLLHISSGAEMTEAAYDSGVTETLSIDLATDSERVTLNEGIDLHRLPCNDTMEETTEVLKTWSAKSGTVEFKVTSTGETSGYEWYADAEVTLTDVVLESPTGETLSLPNETISGNVGWLPG